MLPPGSNEVFLWDPTTPGFGARIRRGKTATTRTWIVQYRNQRGRTRRIRLGAVSELALPDARRKAREHLSKARLGADPAQERDEGRRCKTVADLMAEYLERHARPKKKPSSVLSDEVNIRNHVLPALGAMPLDEVKREHVTRLHDRMHRTPGAANRTLALLSKAFNLAEKWGLREGANPCRWVDKYPEKPRRRYLDGAELARLGDALREAENGRLASTSAIAAIRLLLLTGARSGEILRLRWSEVHLEQQKLHLDDSKTGAKTIALSAPALQVLADLPRCSEWVLPGRTGKPLRDIRKPFQAICARAELEGLRPHDLRHAHASIAASRGHSLNVIGALLGHRSTLTTARYAHLLPDAHQGAVEDVAAAIMVGLGAGA